MFLLNLLLINLCDFDYLLRTSLLQDYIIRRLQMEDELIANVRARILLCYLNRLLILSTYTIFFLFKKVFLCAFI